MKDELYGYTPDCIGNMKYWTMEGDLEQNRIYTIPKVNVAGRRLLYWVHVIELQRE